MTLKDDLYKDLMKGITSHGMSAIIKEVHPSNGKTIKLLGKVLYKDINLPNPYGFNGAIVHNSIDDGIIKSLGGIRKTSKKTGKKNYVIVPVTSLNYDQLLNTLLKVVEAHNAIRSSKMKHMRKKPSRKEKTLSELQLYSVEPKKSKKSTPQYEDSEQSKEIENNRTLKIPFDNELKLAKKNSEKPKIKAKKVKLN